MPNILNTYKTSIFIDICIQPIVDHNVPLKDIKKKLLFFFFYRKHLSSGPGLLASVRLESMYH